MLSWRSLSARLRDRHARHACGEVGRRRACGEVGERVPFERLVAAVLDEQCHEQNEVVGAEPGECVALFK